MRHRRLPLLFLLALVPALAGVSCPAIALALGGSCDAATPCECGDEVIGDKQLSDVDPITSTVCTANGLFLLKEVALDLNGHTLRGSGGGIGVATRFTFCPPPLPLLCSFGQEIRGGTIADFGVGIGPYTDTMRDTRISGMRLIDNVFFAVGLAGFDNLIEHTLIEGGALAVLVQGNGNTLQRLTIRNTSGIVAVTLPRDSDDIGNLVLDNRIEDSRGELYPGDGIWISGANNVVARNVVIRSAGEGIVVSSDYLEAINNTVNNNLVYFSGGNGLRFEGVGLTVFRNVAKNNGGDGLQVAATASTFDRNQSFSNGGFGIEDSTAGDGIAGTANTYTSNICYTANALGKSSPVGLCR